MFVLEISCVSLTRHMQYRAGKEHFKCLHCFFKMRNMKIIQDYYPKKPLDMLPLILRLDQPHIMLTSQIKQECNYEPDRNVQPKSKWAAKKEKEKKIDHSQMSSVAKVIIQHSHKVNCPAHTCIKIAFFLMTTMNIFLLILGP